MLTVQEVLTIISSNYKLKIIVIIGAVLSSLVIVASTLSYFKVADIMREQVLETSSNDIRSIQMSTETVINVLNNSLMQAALDVNLEHFSNRYEFLTIFDIEKIYNRLYSLRSANFYFKNLYVYYPEDGKVIDLNSNDARFIDLSKIQNINMLIQAKQMFEYERYSSQSSVYNLSIKNDENVMTMIMPVKPIDNKPKALIIMTLDRAFFQDLVLKSRIADEENIYVIDNKGNFLFGKSTDMKTVNTPELENLDSGSLQLTVNNEKYLTSFITSEKTGWKYIYEVPCDYMFNKIKIIEVFLFTLTSISVLLTGVISIIIGNALHKPIKKMTTALINENKDESILIKDEIKYINDNIENLIVEKKSIKQLLIENQPLLKNAAIEKLLTGALDSNLILKKLEHYNISIHKNSYYAVSVLAIDQYDNLPKMYSDKQIDTLVVYIKETIEEVLKKYPCIAAETILSHENHFVILLSFDVEQKIDANERLKKVISEIFEDLIPNISVSFTMGISGVCDDISQISHYYEQAIKAYDYKIIMGTGNIIHFSEVPVLNQNHYRYPFELENEIFKCLKQPDMVGIDEAIDKYFIYMKENMQNYEITKYSFIQLLNDTLQALSDLSINSEVIFPETNNMYEQILSMETIDDVQKYFYDIFKGIHEYVCIRKSNKDNDVPQRIIEYIDNNYEKDIGLESIASEMHYSVSYLVKVFRYATGKSIKEYLTETRIIKAKEFLAQKDVKIVDVAKKVGYTNTRSFINIFKKNVGVTPGKYKQDLIDASV